MREKKIRQKKKNKTKERGASYSYKHLLDLPWKEECSQLTVASWVTNGNQNATNFDHLTAGTRACIVCSGAEGEGFKCFNY